MGTFDEKIGKHVTKRNAPADPLLNAAILLDTISRLQGGKLFPKGVYKFSSFKEADKWALKMMASTHEHRD